MLLDTNSNDAQYNYHTRNVLKDNEGHRDGRIIHEYDSENVYTTVHTMPNTAMNCFRTATSDTYHTISAMNDIPDDSCHA